MNIEELKREKTIHTYYKGERIDGLWNVFKLHTGLDSGFDWSPRMVFTVAAGFFVFASIAYITLAAAYFWLVSFGVFSGVDLDPLDAMRIVPILWIGVMALSPFAFWLFGILFFPIMSVDNVTWASIFSQCLWMFFLYLVIYPWAWAFNKVCAFC